MGKKHYYYRFYTVDMNNNKIYAFDYMLSLFEEWYKEEANEAMNFQKCSKLSVLKLLFLTAAPKDDGSEDLLNLFNKFYALPFGPVESDVYDAIKLDKLPSYIVTEKSISKKQHVTLPYSCDKYINIKKAVDALKDKNKKLILLDAFSLVEITHKWESWRQSIAFARLMDMLSYKMSVDSIRNDKNKYFE